MLVSAPDLCSTEGFKKGAADHVCLAFSTGFSGIFGTSTHFPFLVEIESGKTGKYEVSNRKVGLVFVSLINYCRTYGKL